MQVRICCSLGIFHKKPMRVTLTMIVLAIYLALLSIQRLLMHVDRLFDVGLYLIEELPCRPPFSKSWGGGGMNGAPLAIGWGLGATVSEWIHPDQSSWRPFVLAMVLINIQTFDNCLTASN